MTLVWVLVALIVQSLWVAKLCLWFGHKQGQLDGHAQGFEDGKAATLGAIL
jgi:hypothetical protein